MQLTLELFGRGRLRPAVEEYMTMQCRGLACGTMADYEERARWLYKVIGEWRLLVEITYPLLCRVAREQGPDGAGLRQVTVKKRLVFLRAVLSHAYGMGDCPAPPDLPKLRDDGERSEIVHTVEQFAAFRKALPPGPFRRLADVAFWCGFHRLDLFDCRRWMFNPDHEFIEQGKVIARGAFWRLINKSKKKVKPVWFPLEPEAVPHIQLMLAEIGPSPEELITGPLWNLSKTFFKACDRAEVPRVSPIRLRSSMATRLRENGYSSHYVQMALGHVGEQGDDDRAKRTTVAQRHYLKYSPGVLHGSPTYRDMVVGVTEKYQQS